MADATSEQLRIRGIRQGLNVIGANAGTGKTHTSAELICDLYLFEEEKRFPARQGHVSGDDQRTLLEQFMPVTFTRDAAKELDSRILKMLSERGVPAPVDRWGRQYVICRTLDSHVQRWFKNPEVFAAWMDIDLDFRRAISRALDRSSDAIRDLLKSSRRKPQHALFLNWTWIPPADVTDFILDCIIRETDDELGMLDDISPMAEWESEWLEWLSKCTPPLDESGKAAAAWNLAFWQEKMKPYTAFQTEMRQMRDEYRAGKLESAENIKEVVAEVQSWEAIQMTKREFGSVYELARSNGYHPVRAKEKMMNTTVMHELAASDHVSTFFGFHQIAYRFYAAKVMFMILDHTDFLNLFVEATERNIGLLEHDKEYPTKRIRCKYTFFDESQDNNNFQNRIVELWTAAPGVPYCTVACGDVKQAIYGFKGASSYGFASLIERVRKHHPENFFTLSCSFRSLSSIVEFGNSIVQTLPHYKASVTPSTTIYTEPGSIVVLPPLQKPTDEAEAVKGYIEQILANTSDTVMVIHRNNLASHPLHPWLEANKSDRLTYMTIHRSKGLQADHVFVLGLTAGILPDIRGSYTQEVNLFYVACTRPRKALYLSAPYAREKTNKAGRKEWKDVGPSVFFNRLPCLKTLADESGWPTDYLMRGESTTADFVDEHMKRVNARLSYLKAWWAKNHPQIPIKDADGETPRNETGAAPVPPSVANLPKRSIWEDGKITAFELKRKLDDNDPRMVRMRSELKRRLAEQCLKNNTVPRLKRDDFIVAIKSGWVIKNGGRLEFSDSFIKDALSGRGAAA